jgi:hypothetical protein
MARFHSFAWVLGLSAACTPLQEIAANVCGNGVIEKGEDCDRFVDKTLGGKLTCAQAGEPHQCHYVCTPTSDGSQPADCPGGWSCGQDGVCRYASGEFREPALLTMSNAEGFDLGDVDGDGLLDLVSWLGATLTVRYGAGLGRFTDAGVLEVDGRTGAPRVVDVDGDGKADLVVPSDRGVVVASGARASALVPDAFSLFDLADVDMNQGAHVRFVAVHTTDAAPGDRLLFIASSGSDFSMTFDRTMRSPIAALAGKDAADLASIAVHDLDGDGNDEVALAFRQSDQLPLFRTGPAIAAYRDPIIALGGAVDRGARFADVDGDGAIDLLVSLVGGTTAVAFGDGHGGFRAPAEDDRFSALSPHWPILAADLNGDRKADYLDSACVYLSTTASALVPTCISDSSMWTEAIAGDFDGDGFIDVAVASAAQSGIEILFGTGTSRFDRTRIETTGVPTDLQIGDFDGDRVIDLAFVDGGDTVSVLYGRRGGLLSPPIAMARATKIDAIASGNLTPIDLLSDLAVAAGVRGQPRFELLQGTRHMRLLAPLDLVRPSAATPVSDVVETLFVGPFLGANDLFAFSTRPKDAPGAWIVGGDPVLLFDRTAEHFVPGTEIMRDSTCTEEALSLCGPSAVGDIDGDRIDEILTADTCLSTPLLRIYHTRGAALSLNLGCTAIPLAAATTGPPTRIEIADVDADHANDVIVTAPSGISIHWGSPGGPSLFDPMPSTIMIAGPHITDAASLNADADPALEIAILTDEGVALVKLEPESRTFGVPKLMTDLRAARGSIRAADVDEDGLADLLYHDGETLHVLLAIPNSEAATP